MKRVTIGAEALRARVATGLVILLFPGFYLYNAGLAKGWFPQFLGGWFGPVSLVVGVPFLAYLAFEIVFKARLHDRIGAFVCVLVAYCIAWASIYTLLGPAYARATELYYYTVEFLWLWLVTYVTFKHFNYSSKRVAWALFALWLLMFAIAVAGQEHGMYWAAESSGIDPALRIVSYQGFARAGLVTTALIMVWLRGWKVLLFGLGALVFLFLLGARTEFVGVVLIMLVSVIAGRGHWLTKVCVLAIALALVVGLAAQFSWLLDQSRLHHLLSLGQDSSWQLRQSFESRAEQTIRTHWMLGSYGSEMQNGGIGTYAHNALSAWVSFGLLGFLLFVGLNLVCLGYMLSVAIRTGLRTAGLVQFAFAMSVYAAVCMVFAKSVGDPIFAVSWGATAAVAATRRARGSRRVAAIRTLRVREGTALGV